MQKTRQGSTAKKEDIRLKQRGLQCSPGETIRYSMLLSVVKLEYGIMLRGQNTSQHSSYSMKLGCHLQCSGADEIVFKAQLPALMCLETLLQVAEFYGRAFFRSESDLAVVGVAE